MCKHTRMIGKDMSSSGNTITVNINLGSESTGFLESLTELGKQISSSMESAVSAISKFEEPLQKTSQAVGELSKTLQPAIGVMQEFITTSGGLLSLKDELKKIDDSLNSTSSILKNFFLNILGSLAGVAIVGLHNKFGALNILKTIFNGLVTVLLIPIGLIGTLSGLILGLAGSIGSSLVGAIGKIPSKLGKLGLGVLKSRFGKIGLGVAGLAGLFSLSSSTAQAASGSVDEFGNSLDSTSGSASSFFGSMGMVSEILMGVAPLLLSFPGVFGIVGGAFKALGAIAVSNPILAVLTGIALAATLIISNWEGISSFFSGIFDKIKGKLGAFINWLPDWVKSLFGLDGASVDMDVNTNEPAPNADPIKDIGAGLANYTQEYAPSGGMYAAAGAAPVGYYGGASSSTTSNTTNYNISSLEIIAQNGNPSAIMDAFKYKLASLGNTGTRPA